MIKLIVSFAILLAGGSIIHLLFGTGLPLYIFLGIGGLVWFSVNNDLFTKFGG
jgi:hypothetical protein